MSGKSVFRSLSTTRSPNPTVAMADWGQMLEDPLRLIATRLDTQFDVRRFRSVCSRWRSSVAPNPSPSPSILPNDGISDAAGEIHLFKRTTILLGAPRSRDQAVPAGWLLKVKEDVPRRMNLLKPLCQFTPLPEDFPRVLDLMNLRVLELGHEYVLQHMSDFPGNDSHLYMEKVVFLRLDNGKDFALLTIHVSGKLAMIKSEEKRWSIIQESENQGMTYFGESPYHDVILFKGKFYAIDYTGRTVVVGLDLGVTLIAEADCTGDKKNFLVESVGELLLVNMFTVYVDDDDDDSLVAENSVGFNVYKLNGEENVWNEVKDLGDRVLFLGDHCTFSASAADLRTCKGNCILFVDNWELEGLKGAEIGVYDMDSRDVVPLKDYAGYSELFWPPPIWIASRTSSEPQVQNQSEALAV